MLAGLSKILIPPSSRAQVAVAVATLVTIIVAVAIVTSTGRFNGLFASISDKIQARYAFMRQSEDEERAFESVTATIPEDARVLVFLPRAYLLPPGSFQIVVNDQPGRAGPPPFWPQTSSGTEVLSYLRSNAIDFVLVPGDLTVSLACNVGTPLSQWDRKLVESGCEFAMAVVSEPLSSRIVHQDSFVRLIDLRPTPKGLRGLRATEAPTADPLSLLSGFDRDRRNPMVNQRQ
jgi:hypothetical protein